MAAVLIQAYQHHKGIRQVTSCRGGVSLIHSWSMYPACPSMEVGLPHGHLSLMAGELAGKREIDKFVRWLRLRPQLPGKVCTDPVFHSTA